jgi:hypothetical protein
VTFPAAEWRVGVLLYNIYKMLRAICTTRVALGGCVLVLSRSSCKFTCAMQMSEQRGSRKNEPFRIADEWQGNFHIPGWLSLGLSQVSETRDADTCNSTFWLNATLLDLGCVINSRKLMIQFCVFHSVSCRHRPHNSHAYIWRL